MGEVGTIAAPRVMGYAEPKAGDDIYVVWRAALKGEALPRNQHLPTRLFETPPVKDVGLDNTHPQPGLYRRREGGGYRDGVKVPHRWMPVKIYLADSEGTVIHKWGDGLTLCCVVGLETVEKAADVWKWCQGRGRDGVLTPNAVTQVEYKFWIANGRWSDDMAPDDPVARESAAPPTPPEIGKAGTVDRVESLDANAESPAGIGHNSGDDPDDYDAIVRTIAQHDGAVSEWLGTKPEGERAGHKAANWLNDVRSVKAKAKALYEIEKAPIQAQLDACTARWTCIDQIEETRKRLAAAVAEIGAKELARKQRIAETEAKAKAEALRKQAEAERAQRIETERRAHVEQVRDAPPGAAPAVAPEQLPLEPIPTPVVAPAKVKVSFGGSTGRKVGLRAVKKAIITDWAKAATYYAGSDRLRDLIQKLADADAKNGICCDGATIDEGVAAT